MFVEMIEIEVIELCFEAFVLKLLFRFTSHTYRIGKSIKPSIAYFTHAKANGALERALRFGF